MHLNGVPLPPHQLNPLAFHVPREGFLQLDYVTYDLPNPRFQHTLHAAASAQPRDSSPRADTSEALESTPRVRFADVAGDLALATDVASLQREVEETKASFEHLAAESAGATRLRQRQKLNFSQLGHDTLAVMTSRHMACLARILLAGPGVGRGVTEEVVLRAMRCISHGEEPSLDPVLEPATEK